MNDNSTYYTDLITRYFSGEIAEDELHLLTDWLKADLENEEIFRQYQKTWQLIEKQKIHSSVNLNQEWKALKAEMNVADSEINNSGKVIQLDRKKSRRSSFHSIWLAAAAVIVLLVSTVQLYYYFSKPGNIVVTAQASNIEQVLPDGSVVSLHAGSQITYPSKFTTNSRNVELKGEAYFIVSHDWTKPFIVTSGEARVEVLGTQFNVNTNSLSGNMEVVLTSGKVSVYYSDNLQNIILLDPGEKAILNTEQKKISKSANTDANYMAWKTHQLVFDNKTLPEIVNTLQNVYQTQVSLADSQLSECRVTASFSNQSLESVLQVLKETLGLQIKQVENRIEISGNGCK